MGNVLVTKIKNNTIKTVLLIVTLVCLPAGNYFLYRAIIKNPETLLGLILLFAGIGSIWVLKRVNMILLLFAVEKIAKVKIFRHMKVLKKVNKDE